MGEAAAVEKEELIVHRNSPGTRNEERFNWPDEEMTEMKTSLYFQTYIHQLLRKDNTQMEKIIAIPPTFDKTDDRPVWVYEQLRQVSLELSLLISLLEDVCTKTTCPEMKAEQFQYLCAAHRKPKECCAIDYMVHTLNGTTALLNSNKWFPSRFEIKKESMQSFSSISRRLYRLFAHSFFHHREVFDEFEEKTHLCERFTKLCLAYGLMPKKLMIIRPSQKQA